jgi:hypothetical protein
MHIELHIELHGWGDKLKKNSRDRVTQFIKENDFDNVDDRVREPDIRAEETRRKTHRGRMNHGKNTGRKRRKICRYILLTILIRSKIKIEYRANVMELRELQMTVVIFSTNSWADMGPPCPGARKHQKSKKLNYKTTCTIKLFVEGAATYTIIV